MSKLRADNINYDEHDFLVKVKTGDEVFIPEIEPEDIKKKEAEILEQKKAEVIQEAQIKAKKILENAQMTSSQIIDEANIQAATALENANNEALKIKEDAQKEAQETLEKAQQEAEELRAQKALEGYKEGHTDGLNKVQEELEEKIKDFNEFCKIQPEIKEKTLLSLSNEILKIIDNISKKVLLKELDGVTLEKIIKTTISKLEKKESITLILSEKYAKLLFELQKKELDNDNTELKFEEFKQYSNFEVIYNPKFAPDTIIVENLKERLDASVSSQLDIILRDIYDNVEKTTDGRLEIESDLNNEA